MSRAIRGSSAATVLTTPAEVEAYLLAKVQGATAGLIGLEQEMFVTTPEGTPPAFARIEAVLCHMAAALPQARLLTEGSYVVGVSSPVVGDVCLEPGGQIELSSAPSQGLKELAARQQALYDALVAASAREGLQVTGAGHMPSFIGAPMVPRSRFAAYVDYCARAHGDEKAQALLDTMKSCTGLQVNVDPMGEDFHKIYRALLLVELSGSFNDLSIRQKRFFDTYAPLFPRQVTPLFNAAAARDNESLMEMVVERLLLLHMPFVPDPASEEGFLPSAQVYGQTPTVGELMGKGVLTTDLLDNALSLQMTMPNLRRHGVVETRNPDTPSDMAGVMAVAARYHRAAYDVPTRDRLVTLLDACDPALLQRAYMARFAGSRADLSAMSVGGGMTVAGLIAAVDSVLAPQSAAQQVCKNTAVSKLKFK